MRNPENLAAALVESLDETIATFINVETHDLDNFSVEVDITLEDSLSRRGAIWDVSISVGDLDVDVDVEDVPDFSVRVTRGMLNDLSGEERTAILNHLVLGGVLPVMAPCQVGPDKVSEVVNMYLNGAHPRAVLTAVFTWLVGRLSI